VSLEAVVRQIESRGDLPTIGAVAARVVRLAADPDMDFRAVGRIIEQDPALAARVLRVANSPYYGVPGRVGTVERAVALLGFSQIRNIALSLSLISDLSRWGDGEEAFRWDRFWEHSVGCAYFSEALARQAGLPASGGEYAGGLLHDVGKILLGHHFPREFQEALRLAARERQGLLEAERRVFGTDHAEVGGWLAAKWSFPPDLLASIRHHHAPDAAGEYTTVARIVHVADLFTKAKCIGFGGDVVAVCLAEDPAWQRLVRDHPGLGGLDVERFTLRLDQEVELARDLARTAERQ